MNPEQVKQQWQGVYRFALFLTRDPSASEEIAQETFRVALSTSPPPESPNPGHAVEAAAWLRGIARNLARNHIRKKRRKWVLFSSGILELAEAHFIASGAGDDEVWESRKLALATCMGKLGEPDRNLIRRRYEQGEHVSAMAVPLGMEANSVSKRLERIRKALRDCINNALGRNRNE
jgi:RNA polymerase sigma-70 factor, ECF subfamily